MGIIGPIETDNVIALIFDPHASHETAGRRIFLGLDVDHQAAYFSQKFTPYKREVIVLLLKIGIENHHLRKAQGQKAHGKNTGKMCEHLLSETGLADELLIFGLFA